MNAAEDVAALREMARESAAALNRGDLDGVMCFYGAQYVDVNLRKPVQTHAERRAYFESVLRRRKLRIAVEPDEIVVEGALAFVRGRLDVFDLDQNTKTELRYMEIARRSPNGWQVIWGMDGPVQEYTAAVEHEREVLRRIDRLLQFSQYLRTALQSTPPEVARQRPVTAGFSLVEQACHLRDYEAMGVHERIQRMLQEERPFLPPFPGERLAVERDYLGQDLPAALDSFCAERAKTAACLKTLTLQEWRREANFADEGTITVARLVEIVTAHDTTHRHEIDELLREIAASQRDMGP